MDRQKQTGTPAPPMGWFGTTVSSTEGATEAPGVQGEVINRERWAGSRFGARLDGAGVARWLEVEILHRPLEIPVGSSRSRSEMKVLIGKSDILCPKLAHLFFPEPLSYGS